LDVLKIVLYKAVVSDLLKNLKLNGGSTTATVDVQITTLVRACEDILPVQPFWVGTKFKLETSPEQH